jgi:hypothetical protein
MNNSTTSVTNGSTGTLSTTLGTTLSGYSGTLQSSGYQNFNVTPTTPFTTLTFSTINSNTIMQNKVAVFKVTRNDKNQITSAEFIKELWVETKNGQTVEFEVARDKDLAKYKSEDLSIRTIYSVTF